MEIAAEPQDSPGSQAPEVPQITAAEQSPDPVTFEITHVEAGQPQIVRIFNLDEGTREIDITHVETSEPQIVRILNPDEGTHEIVLPPTP